MKQKKKIFIPKKVKTQKIWNPNLDQKKIFKNILENNF